MPVYSGNNGANTKKIKRPGIAQSVAFAVGGVATIFVGLYGYQQGYGFVINGIIPVNGLVLSGFGVLLIAYAVYRIVKAIKIDAKVKRGELRYSM